ncbi:hypothetical protein [Actibacterium sp. 188UL27-1]|uniref:hypothetical protein n=1 Tax=Actibacterium sp. 188UL27-1 TaxID=2786961 RepID=UPI00195EC82C|nr:hypothetical protein [Actibacterium sp. 188UL27-1]MBM7068669.1 hypothetical protein [Actibacterium sp. 188UL27-1]
MGYLDALILGISGFEWTVAATDFLANTSATHISRELPGLEEGDQVWIDGDDPNRLWVN